MDSKREFNWVVWCAITIALTIGLLIIYLVLALCGEKIITRLASVGDAFGWVTSLVTALGFIGLLYTINQQKQAIEQQKEAILQQEKSITHQETALRIQGEALNTQIAEMKLDREEMERSRAEFEKQTQQFKKTYELERRARVVAARPVFCCDRDTEYIFLNAEDVNLDKKELTIDFELSNNGASVSYLILHSAWICVGEGNHSELVRGAVEGENSFLRHDVSAKAIVNLYQTIDFKLAAEDEDIKRVAFFFTYVDTLGYERIYCLIIEGLDYAPNYMGRGKAYRVKTDHCTFDEYRRTGYMFNEYPYLKNAYDELRLQLEEPLISD